MCVYVCCASSIHKTNKIDLNINKFQQYIYIQMTTRKIINDETFRNNIREKLDILVENENKSKNIEKGVYNYSLKEATRLKVVKKWDNSFFVQIYIDRLRSMFLNLKNNPSFLEKIKGGTVSAKDTAFMTHYDFYPEKWAKMMEEKTIRDKNKYEEQKLVASTDVFKCRKCGSRETTYMSIQTRSCDEPTTNFVTCITCGNNWKC